MFKTGLLILFAFICQRSYAQMDSVLHSASNYNMRADEKLQDAEDLKQVPDKYIKDVNSKIDQYNKRMTAKTIKTLKKLSKWEDKIHTLLLKASPQTAQQLFGNGQETFSTLLQKMQQGQSITENYQSKYDVYTDKLSTNLKYLQQEKDKLDSNLVKPVVDANNKMAAVTKEEDNTEVVQQFINQRKKQLADGALKYLQNSKYLDKMGEENYYYVATLKNYKELFSDPDKAEQTATDIVNKIPGFQKFTQQNSILASIFGSPSATGNVQALTGLQTRDQTQDLMQQQISSGGPNAQQTIMQDMQQAQSQLKQLKDKLNQGVGNSSDIDMPKGFKPDMQKTKTFAQRIEYGSNIQFVNSNQFVPGSTDMAVTEGYILNDKSTVGMGASYKVGMGTLQHVDISSQGEGLRSYLDWKLIKQLYVSGGFEMNYYNEYSNIAALKQDNSWQQSALVGMTEKLNIGSKFFKTTNVQLLYDFLSKQHEPVSQPLLFRVGYNF
jgi:hypothetical protein